MRRALDIHRETFVAELARACPDVPPLVVATAAKRLMLAARKLSRIAVCRCNAGDSPRLERAERRARREAAEYSLTLPLTFGGDPRGYVLHIHLPSGRYNTMGGADEGWGVPDA